jgi:RimJ/RimL family protein N-acetyltransferase
VSDLVTERLRLRTWRNSDLEPFAALNADPEVMRHFPEPLDREASDALVGRIKAHFDLHGFGPWVVEIPGITDCAGFVGLMVPTFEAHFTPCIEIGWRLARRYWGKGYATEAATAALTYAFDTLQADEVVAITVPANRPSRAVMERLGMIRDPYGDFDHPNLPVGHVLQRHVLYRKKHPSFDRHEGASLQHRHGRA